jgi:hypothetical protein
LWALQAVYVSFLAWEGAQPCPSVPCTLNLVLLLLLLSPGLLMTMLMLTCVAVTAGVTPWLAS